MSNRKRVDARSYMLAGGALGDVARELHSKGHITDREYAAAGLFLRYLQASHGSSAGIIGEIMERVDTSTRSSLAPPGGGDPDSFEKLCRIFQGLRPHERRKVEFLINLRERAGRTMADWGSRSRYETQKTRACFSVGQFKALFETIADLCQLPSEAETAAMLKRAKASALRSARLKTAVVAHL